jgi:hypothetical protein
MWRYIAIFENLNNWSSLRLHVQANKAEKSQTSCNSNACTRYILRSFHTRRQCARLAVGSCDFMKEVWPNERRHVELGEVKRPGFESEFELDVHIAEGLCCSPFEENLSSLCLLLKMVLDQERTARGRGLTWVVRRRLKRDRTGTDTPRNVLAVFNQFCLLTDVDFGGGSRADVLRMGGSRLACSFDRFVTFAYAHKIPVRLPFW